MLFFFVCVWLAPQNDDVRWRQQDEVEVVQSGIQLEKEDIASMHHKTCPYQHVNEKVRLFMYIAQWKDVEAQKMCKRLIC